MHNDRDYRDHLAYSPANREAELATHLTISINLLGINKVMGRDGDVFVNAAQAAERSGIDGIVLPDHVAMSDNTEQYPFHEWDAPPDMHWPEPLTLLAAIAAATTDVNLATSVLIAPLRPAAFLAKQVATLDQISGGRFELGIGLGWQREEYEACGLDFNERREILLEQVQACRSLWGPSPSQHQGNHIHFGRLWSHPKPTHGAHLPLWFGWAMNKENANFTAQVDGGWASIKSDPEFIRRGKTRLQEAYRRLGKDPDNIRVRTSPAICLGDDGMPCLEKTLRTIPDSVAAGVTHLDFPIAFFVSNAEQFNTFTAALGRFERPALQFH